MSSGKPKGKDFPELLDFGFFARRDRRRQWSRGRRRRLRRPHPLPSPPQASPSSAVRVLSRSPPGAPAPSSPPHEGGVVVAGFVGGAGSSAPASPTGSLRPPCKPPEARPGPSPGASGTTATGTRGWSSSTSPPLNITRNTIQSCSFWHTGDTIQSHSFWHPDSAYPQGFINLPSGTSWRSFGPPTLSYLVHVRNRFTYF